MLSLVGEIWFIAISITVSIETVVAHQFTKRYRKILLESKWSTSFWEIPAEMSLSKKNDNFEGQVQNSGRFSS